MGQAPNIRSGTIVSFVSLAAALSLSVKWGCFLTIPKQHGPDSWQMAPFGAFVDKGEPVKVEQSESWAGPVSCVCN